MPAHLVRIVCTTHAHDLAIGRAGRARVGDAVVAGDVGDERDAKPVEVLAQEELVQGLEGRLGEEHLGGPVADPPAMHSVVLVLGDAMRVGALQAEHAALVAQVGTVVPMRAGKALQLRIVEAREFQGVEIGALGSADAQRARRQVVGNRQHTGGRVDMGGNDDATRLVDDLVGLEKGLRAGYRGRAQIHFFIGHAELVEHSLEFGDAGLTLGWKDGQRVGAKLRSKLKAR